MCKRPCWQQEEQALAVKAGQERLAQLQAKDDGTGFSDAKVVSRVKSDGWTQEAFNAVMKADTAKLPAYVGAETPGLGYQIYRVTKVEQPKTVDTARRKAEQEQIAAACRNRKPWLTWTTCARRPRPSCSRAPPRSARMTPPSE
jgi:hypothetical protein